MYIMCILYVDYIYIYIQSYITNIHIPIFSLSPGHRGLGTPTAGPRSARASAAFALRWSLPRCCGVSCWISAWRWRQCGRTPPELHWWPGWWLEDWPWQTHGGNMVESLRLRNLEIAKGMMWFFGGSRKGEIKLDAIWKVLMSNFDGSFLEHMRPSFREREDEWPNKNQVCEWLLFAQISYFLSSKRSKSQWRTYHDGELPLPGGGFNYILLHPWPDAGGLEPLCRGNHQDWLDQALNPRERPRKRWFLPGVPWICPSSPSCSRSLWSDCF